MEGAVRVLSVEIESMIVEEYRIGQDDVTRTGRNGNKSRPRELSSGPMNGIDCVS